jgi:hypothetical protein
MDKQAAFKHFVDQRKIGSVDVPEWGGPIHFVGHPNVDEWCEITKAMVGESSSEAYWRAFFLLTRTAEGARLWGDHEEREARQQLDMRIVHRVVDASGAFEVMSKKSIAKGKKH